MGIFTRAHASNSLLSKVWKDIPLSYMKFQNNLDFLRSWFAVAFSSIPRPLCCHDSLLCISAHWHKRCSEARPESGPRTRRILANLRMREEHTSSLSGQDAGYFSMTITNATAVSRSRPISNYLYHTIHSILAQLIPPITHCATVSI